MNVTAHIHIALFTFDDQPSCWISPLLLLLLPLQFLLLVVVESSRRRINVEQGKGISSLKLLEEIAGGTNGKMNEVEGKTEGTAFT